MPSAQDPGWRPALSWRLLLFAAFPAILTPRFGLIGTGPVIVRARMQWLSSIIMLTYILLITSVVVRDQEPIDTPSWWWPVQLAYSVVGLLFSAVVIVMNAPTRGSLVRRQEELQRKGSTRSLIDALEPTEAGRGA